MFAKNKKDGVKVGDNSIVIGGNVQGSTITIGNGNHITTQTIHIDPLFKTIYEKVEKSKDLSKQEKADIKEELKEIQTVLEQPEPDETFLERRFRNLKRMAPDITEVAFETLKNPIGGVAEVIKRIAKKATEEADAK